MTTKLLVVFRIKVSVEMGWFGLNPNEKSAGHSDILSYLPHAGQHMRNREASLDLLLVLLVLERTNAEQWGISRVHPEDKVSKEGVTKP